MPPPHAVCEPALREGLAQGHHSPISPSGALGVSRPEIATQRPQSQRAAVAVETAKFNEHGGDRTQESFKGSNEPLNEIAEATGVTRPMIVYAKTVWDAAEEADDHCLHVAISPADPP